MASYVLDTHALALNMTRPDRLGTRARALLRRVEQGKDRALVPAAVVAELALLRELKRIEVGLPELHGVLSDVPSVQFLPLDLPQLDAFAALSSLRDPFDRLIVSAARVSGFKLITRDTAIADSGLVETIWD